MISRVKHLDRTPPIEHHY